MDETRAGWGFRAARAEDGRIYPMAIRRVAVIEVIAILCPVPALAVLARCGSLSLFRSLFHVYCLGRDESSPQDRVTRVTLIFLSL